MIKLAVVTKQISRDDVVFIIHAVGCKDIEKDVARHEGVVDHYESESAGQWMADEINSLALRDDGGGWSERQFKIMPCTKTK